MDLGKLAIGISVRGTIAILVLIILFLGIAFWGFPPMLTGFGALTVVLAGVLSIYFFVKKNISN